VCYLGTATYDALPAEAAQTARLAEAGCSIRALRLLGSPAPSAEAIAGALRSADIILVSGGNSLFMLDTWRKLGVDAELRRAAARGAVFGGGSAGLGWVFEGVHSDSADPATFRAAASAAPETAAAGAGSPASSWAYIRVPALGLLPGLAVPHFDQVQSNGIPRELDARAMLRRHSAELMVCVDHWAALRLDGSGGFAVLALPGKFRAGQAAEAGEGRAPGVRLLSVPAAQQQQQGEEAPQLLEQELPQQGSLSEWLRPASGPITEDPGVEACRRANPA
jgi:dipeptidase E